LLCATYDPSQDDILVTITGNDVGFRGRANQTAVVTKPDGTAIATGVLYDEACTVIAKPLCGTVFLDRIEIGGAHIGFFSTEPLLPGQPYPVKVAAAVASIPDNRPLHSQFQSMSCFGPGTMITTQDGALPIEWLALGDKVLTRDNGYQPIMWIGRFDVADPLDNQFPAAVEIAAGGLGPDLPQSKLRVTPGLRVLFQDPMLCLYFHEQEALISAECLVDGNQIALTQDRGNERFYQFVLPDHELVLAEGLWVESLLLTDQFIAAQPPKTRRELQVLTDGCHKRTARMCLNQREAALLRRSAPMAAGGRAA
jgi:hypothetical protein